MIENYLNFVRIFPNKKTAVGCPWHWCHSLLWDKFNLITCMWKWQNNYQCAKHSHKNAEFNLPSLRSKMFPVPFRLYSDTCHGKESVWEVISSPPFVKCKRLVCQKQHEMSHYIPGAFEHNSFCCRVWLWLVSRLEKDGEVHPPKLVWGFCKHQRFLLTSMLEYAGQSGISFLKNKEEANSDWAILRLMM